MQKVGVSCIDCHMPKMVKSAVAKSKLEGDIRAHIFRINVHPNDRPFYSRKIKGKKASFASNFVSLDFACLNCHKDRSLKWAGKHARGIHSFGKKK